MSLTRATMWAHNAFAIERGSEITPDPFNAAAGEKRAAAE
jgi:hypothetical protein